MKRLFALIAAASARFGVAMRRSSRRTTRRPISTPPRRPQPRRRHPRRPQISQGGRAGEGRCSARPRRQRLPRLPPAPTAPQLVGADKISSGDTAWMLTSTALVLLMTDPRPRAVLRRHGAQEERAGDADAELRDHLSGHGALGDRRLQHGVHARQPVHRQPRPPVPQRHAVPERSRKGDRVASRRSRFPSRST